MGRNPGEDAEPSYVRLTGELEEGNIDIDQKFVANGYWTGDGIEGTTWLEMLDEFFANHPECITAISGRAGKKGR